MVQANLCSSNTMQISVRQSRDPTLRGLSSERYHSAFPALFRHWGEQFKLRAFQSRYQTALDSGNDNERVI